MTMNSLLQTGSKPPLACQLSPTLYSLVKGNGDVDNGSFTVDGDKLVASESFDFEGDKRI